MFQRNQLQHFMLLFLTVIILGSFILGAAQTPPLPLSQVIPAPGQLLEVDGQSVHLYCTGQGPSTVILDAGMGEWSIHWAWVQPEVAQFARVCSFDRPGYGWSGALAYAPTPQHTAQLIEKVLAKAGIQDHWILVGHSLGGVDMRLLAERNPQKTKGLVLVDTPGNLPPDPKQINLVNQQLEQLKMVAGLAEQDLIRLSGKDSLPKPNLPPEWVNAYYETLFRPEFYQTYVREAETVLAEPPLPIQSLGNIPVRILSADRPQEIFPKSLSEKLHRHWLEGQETLLALSTNVQQVFVDSDHMIQINRPDIVVEVIRELLQQYACK